MLLTLSDYIILNTNIYKEINKIGWLNIPVNWD